MLSCLAKPSAMKWISSKGMRGYPKLTNIPRVLRYIFDRNNKMCAKTVILTSYDTMSMRTLQKPRRQSGREDKPIQHSEWTSRWKGKGEAGGMAPVGRR